MHRIHAFTIASVLAAFPVGAQTGKPPTSDEIIAIVKAEWVAERQKNIAEMMKSRAEDYTEFNGEAATRVEGKTIATRLQEGYNKEAATVIAAEMLNPKVQFHGDVAILTYNYLGLSQDKEGKVTAIRAKSTRVYAKQGGTWMLVHGHFAADPLPRQ